MDAPSNYGQRKSNKWECVTCTLYCSNIKGQELVTVSLLSVSVSLSVSVTQTEQKLTVLSQSYEFTFLTHFLN